MQKQQGFTLVELIIVIVILGILAVTAAPRFLNFSTDANKSVLLGVKGALESSSSLTYGKAIIQGKQSAVNETVDNISVTFGYPKATEAALTAVAELSDFEFGGAVGEVTSGNEVTTPGAIRIGATTDSVADATPCYVLYTASSADGAKPVISIVDTGC